MFDWHFYVQAIISMILITSPPDPVKVLFFNTTIEQQQRERNASALLVAGVVLAILAVSAVIGRELLEVLGINLDAFRVVGGLVIASMGAEMLYGGAPSRAQGQEQRKEGPDEESGLILPLSTPLIAGPGAIVTAITIAGTTDDIEPVLAALLGAVAVAVLVFLSFTWLGDLISRLSARATALLLRLGGLLLATIGTQMLLGGLKNFFAA